MNYIIIFCASYLIYAAVVYAVLHVLVKHEHRHHVEHIISILLSALSAWAVALILKTLIAHQRPDTALALINPYGMYSFPSGHATFMFALAFAMYGFDKRAGKILLALSAIIGAARVLVGVHYWYDIFGGLLLGAGIASIVHVLLRSFLKAN